MTHKGAIEMAYYDIVRIMEESGYTSEGLTIDISIKDDFIVTTDIGDVLSASDLRAVDFRYYIDEYHVYLYHYQINGGNSYDNKEHYKFDGLRVTKNHTYISPELSLKGVLDFCSKAININKLCHKL